MLLVILLRFQSEVFEPGSFTFQGNPSSLTTQDITDFSFTASILDLDAFGNPVAKIIEFDDLLYFDANSVNGSFDGSLRQVPLDPRFLLHQVHSAFQSGKMVRCSGSQSWPISLDDLRRFQMLPTITVTEGTIAIVPEPRGLCACWIRICSYRHSGVTVTSGV